VIKKLFIFFLFTLFLGHLNSLDIFQKRLKILTYNQYDRDLFFWPAKIVLSFNDLQINSCNEISINNSVLTDEFNIIYPFELICLDRQRKVILFYQLPYLNKGEMKSLNFYFDNSTNTLMIKKNATHLDVSTRQRQIFGDDYIYNITFPLPTYRYTYLNIEINVSFSSSSCAYFYLELDDCRSKDYSPSYVGFGSQSSNFNFSDLSLTPCINNKIKEKNKEITVKLTAVGCAKDPGLDFDSLKITYKYPIPYRFGLENVENNPFSIKSDFYTIRAENSKITAKRGKQEISLNLSSSFFISKIPRDQLVSSTTSILSSLSNNEKRNFSFLLELFDPIRHWIESERVSYHKKVMKEDYFSIFYLKGFDSWITFYINFKNYYKLLTKITIINNNLDPDGNLISFRDSLLNLRINRELIPTYYNKCNDLVIFANYTDSLERVPYELVSSNGVTCDITLFIKELNDRLDLYIYHYNKKDYLDKSENLASYSGSSPIYIPLSNLAFSYSSLFNNKKKYSRTYFKLEFLLNKNIKEVYYYLYDPVSKSLSFFNDNSLEYSDSNNLLLKDLLIELEDGNGFILMTFNHYIGNNLLNTLEKGIDNLKISVGQEDPKKIIILANDSNLKDWLISFAFLDDSIDPNSYLNNNISFDLSNPFTIEDYLKQPFSILRNDFDLLSYSKTFTALRDGKDLFDLYLDFDYQKKDLTEIKKENEYYDYLSNYFNIDYSNFYNKEVDLGALIIYPSISVDGTRAEENSIETKDSYGNVNLEVLFSLLTNQSKLFVEKENIITIEVPDSFNNCNLRPNEKYLLIISYDQNSYEAKIYNKDLDLICDSSASISNTNSSFKIGVRTRNNKMVDNNFVLNGVKIHSIKIYKLTKNNVIKNPTINTDNFGYIREINLPRQGYYIIKIKDNHKALYKSNNSEFCYLNEDFECTFEPTNIIHVKSNENIAYFEKVDNKLLYYTSLVTPAYSLVPNSKQIQIDASNAVLGISEYNLVWRNKDEFNFIGTSYPITTRLGRIKWKVIRGLHEYTDILLYSVLDYPFNSQIMSNLNYLLKDDMIEIIK